MDSHSDGQIDTDDEYLNRLRNKTSTYQAIDISKSSAKRHGDTAVVNARAHCGLEFLPAWLDTAQWSARSPSQKWQEVITMGFGQSGDLDRLR